MKKKIFTILIVMLLVVTLFACNGKKGGDEPKGPRVMPVLADLTDYGSDAKYYNVSAVTYTNTDQQYDDLTRAINDEIAEYEQRGGKEGTQFPDETADDYAQRLKDRSTASKIFAAATPEGIMTALSKAALPQAKMVETVAYLAGEENTGAYNPDTSNFIDDIDELDRLKDVADTLDGEDKDDAEDDVARQERLIMGKIFDIGMTGDEFARVVTEGMVYVQTVLAEMIADYNTEESPALDRNAYCKEVLKDYDFLVYVMSFNDIYYGKDGNTAVAANGKQKCATLYGYYYDYNKKAYDTLSDADFEKQLTYSHQDKFTDAEWSDYLRIQKLVYKNSYRYSDSMYKKINDAQMEFKAKQEANDVAIYGINNTAITNPYNATYNKQAKEAQKFLSYQMEMTDLLYFYAEDEDGKDTPEIMAYNAANTAYQNALAANGDDKDATGVAIPRLKYEYAQLQIADYLLNSMNNNSLTGVLKFQIYSYSADSIGAYQSKSKEIVLYNVGIKEVSEEEVADFTNQEPAPNPVPGYIYDTPVQEAVGRATVIRLNMSNNYSQADISNQLEKAGRAAWDTIRSEVKATLDQSYNYSATGKAAQDELTKFEDTLIKKNYDYDGETKLDTWNYDTNHETSRLLDTHQSVFRYAMGKTKVTFRSMQANTNNAHGFKGSLHTPDHLGKKLPARVYIQISVKENGEPLLNILFNSTPFDKIDYDKDDTPTHTELTKNPGNLVSVTVAESSGGSSSLNFTYAFEFDGWYLDKDLKYKFIEGTDLECDISLYAGYKITKTQAA